MNDRELVIVIDFGGQYNQLVARRVRECNVYCEIYSYRTDIEKIKEMHPKGIIVCDDAATVELKVGTVNYFKDIEKKNLDPTSLM